MNLLNRCILGIVLLQINVASTGHAQAIHAAIAGDFADPSIIRKGNQYYAVGTSSEWAPHFPIYTSRNLVDWKQAGYVFDKTPDWIAGSFWAPEFYFHNNTYFLYYTARRKKDKISCVGVATSKYPDRGFVDRGVVIDFGKEAIDGFVFNDNGQLYIAFKAYGLDKRPIEILGSKLSADGLHLEGEPFSMLKDENRMGMEGESILNKDGYYYLFYSAGNCCGVNCSYNLRVARSKTFQGPYEIYSANPILSENADWKCSGHGTFVQTPDNKYQYLYHAYNKESTVFTGRQGLLAELVWTGADGWPAFNTPVAVAKDPGIKDVFEGNKPAKRWQWDFRHATPVVKQNNGSLHLSGSTKENNKAGVVLTVRPAELQFTASARISNQNSALKGLAYYGDATIATGIGVAGREAIVWIVKDTTRSILAKASLQTGLPVSVKIVLLADHSFQYYYQQGRNDWQELVIEQPIKADAFPQWDRSPRIGLHYQGPASQEAIFTSFGLQYP